MTGLAGLDGIDHDRAMTITWHSSTTGGGGWRQELTIGVAFLALRAARPDRRERLADAVRIAFSPARRYERADQLNGLVADAFFGSQAFGDLVAAVERSGRRGR